MPEDIVTPPAVIPAGETKIPEGGSVKPAEGVIPAVPGNQGAPGTTPTGKVAPLDGGTPAPVKVELPEGVNLDPEVLKSITESSKDSAAAQKVADSLVAAAKKVQEGWESTKKEFEKDLRADTEFGGKNFDANMQGARDFIKAFVKQDEIPFLTEAGLDKHPTMVKIWARAGLAIGEGSIEGTKPTERSAGPPQDNFNMIYKDEQAKRAKEQ